MDGATLSSQEAKHLVLSILEGVAAIEDGEPLRDSWAAEMREWCDLLLSRTWEEGGPTRN